MHRCDLSLSCTNVDIQGARTWISWVCHQRVVTGHNSRSVAGQTGGTVANLLKPGLNFMVPRVQGGYAMSVSDVTMSVSDVTMSAVSLCQRCLYVIGVSMSSVYSVDGLPKYA